MAPATTAAPETDATPDTATATALKSTAAGVVPAGGAAAGALTGAEVGALVPILGETGLGELGGAFIGAIAGSIAASKGQSAVLSKVAPKAEEQLAVNEQAHPIASAIGDIASSLPAFEFAPGQTVDGVVAAWKAARGLPLGRTEAEIASAKDALTALAAQSGMATAGGVVAPLVQGQTPDLKDIGLNILTALTFGRPYGADRFKGVFKNLGLPEPPSAKGQGGDSTTGAAPVTPPVAPASSPVENPAQLYKVQVPPAVQSALTQVAQKEVNQGADNLDPEDWSVIQGTTDQNHPDYHPAANVFYLKAKAAAQQQKAKDAATEMAKPDVPDAISGTPEESTKPDETPEEQPNIQDIRPAVRTDDNQLLVGDQGDTHKDIIAKNELEAADVDRREFVDTKTGDEISREQLNGMGVPEQPGAGDTDVPGAHASTLAEVQDGKTPLEKPEDNGPVKEPYDFANTKNLSSVGVLDGINQGVKPADVPALEEQYANLNKLLPGLYRDGNTKEMQRIQGKGIYIKGLIEAANKKGPNYDLYMKRLAAQKPAEAAQPALTDLVSKVDTQSVQSVQQTGRTGTRGGRRTAPGFREFTESDDPKEVEESIYDDAVNPNNNGSRLETPKIALLQKGDEVIARTAYSNRTTAAGGKRVQQRYLSGERYEDVLKQGWKPVAALKRTETTNNYRATYSADKWNEAAKLLRDKKAADQRTVEAGLASHEAAKEFGKADAAVEKSAASEQEPEQVVSKIGETASEAGRLEHFTPEEADAIYDSIHGQVEAPEDVLDALKGGGLRREFEAALREAGLFDKIKTPKDMGRAVEMMAGKIYDAYTTSGKNKQGFQKQLIKAILDESGKSSAGPQPERISERAAVGDSENPEAAPAGQSGSGEAEGVGEGAQPEPAAKPAGPTPGANPERPNDTAEPGATRIRNRRANSDRRMGLIEALEKLPKSLSKEQAREAVYNLTVEHGLRESDGPIRSVDEEIAYQLKNARLESKNEVQNKTSENKGQSKEDDQTAKARTVQAQAYVAKVRIAPAKAAQIFRNLTYALRNLGVDVHLLHAATADMAKDMAKYEEWKNVKGELGRSISLSMGDVNAPTVDNLVALLHEAAHAVFARETPERQAILHEAIARATNQTLDLGNFFETVTGKFKSEAERAKIAQEGRLAEATARRLVESGFNPAEARSVVRRIAEAIKNLYQRAAMAIQQAMGLPVSPERALAYFQSRMKMALTGGKADSVVSFLGGPRMTMTEWDHPDAMESKQAGQIVSVRNRNLRGTSDQLETSVSPDMVNPMLEKEPGVASQNIVHGVLHAAITAFNEEGHNEAAIPAADLIRRFGLPEDMYQPGETPASKIAAANENLVKNQKQPVNPNLNIGDIKNEAVQKQAASLGIGALKSLRETWAAKRRVTEQAQTKLSRELKGISEPLNKAITDYTNLDMIAGQAKLRMRDAIDEQREAQKNIPELSGRQSMLDQVMRQLDSDIKGNQMDERYADALNKLYKRLGGEGDLEFSDMLQTLADHNLDWNLPATQLKEQIRLLDNPALEPLKANNYDGRALMAAAITFAKKNDFLVNLLTLRKSKAMDERVLVNKALQAAVLQSKSASLEAQRLLEKITTLKPIAKKLLDGIATMKERQHELIDDLERNRKFIEFHNLAAPIISQALRPLESKVGALNVNVNVSPETEKVPVPQSPDSRPESFLRKTLYLTGKNGEITLKPEIRSDLKKMADWLDANRSNRTNLGAEYNEVESFHEKLSNHLCFFGAADPIKQLWIARWLAPTAEKLRLVGTALAKSVAYMVENANTLYRKYRNDEQKHSREWELRRQSAMKALGITNEDNFKQTVTDVFKDYVSKNRDIRAAFDRNQDATEASVKAGMEHLRADPNTRNLLADPRAAKAVEDFFRKTIEVNRFLADTGKAMGNKVLDPMRVGEKEYPIYRDVIGSEAYEFARGVSDRAQQMFNGMKAWNVMMKDMGKLYQSRDEEALTNILKPRFTKPVADGFVRWICYKEGASSFGAPKTRDGLQDYARRDNVIKAYENARDKNGDFNPIKFAQNLFTIEHGQAKGADLSEFVEDTMHTFDAQYNLLKSMAGDVEENKEARMIPTAGRYIMDARLTDAAPREFYDYIDSDRAALTIMLHSQAYNGAFGRRFENYYQTIAAAKSEQEKYNQQYKNLAASIPGLTGKKLRTAALQLASKSLDENGKPYNVAALREASDNLRTVTKAESEIAGFLSMNRSRPPELNVLAQLMSGFGSLTVSGPGTAFIAHTVAFEQSIRQFGLNADGLGMMKDTAKGSVAAAMRGFLHVIGRQFGIDAEHLDALERNGLSNPNTLMRWQDQLRQVFIRPDYVHNVLGRGAIYAGRAMQLAASRLSAFHYLARVIQLGNSVAWANKMTSVVQRGLEHFADHPEDASNPDFNFSAKQLGVTEGRAYDYLQFAMGKYGLDLREMIHDAMRRRAEDTTAPLLTDAVYRRIAQVSLDDFTMESSPTTRPAFLVNNSLGQLSNPMLGWTLQKTYVVARAMREADGRRSFNGYKTASIAYAAILPMAMMAAYIRNKFDEDVQGKKQNVSDLSTIQNPQQAFLTALDNAARVGTFGIAGEFVNMAANQDNSRPMSLDGRLFFLNTLENVGSSFANLIHQRDFDYATVVRPMLQSLGGNGFYQYAGILNHTFGLDNAESRNMNRISVNNYLRVAGREGNLDVRTYGGMMATASQPTPWRSSIGSMVMAAYSNDAQGFNAARDEAVRRLVEAGNTEQEAQKKVVQYYSDSNPMRVVFRTLPTQGDYQKMLASMDSNGRESTATAMRLYAHYGSQIGMTESLFASGVKREAATRSVTPALDPAISSMLNRLQPTPSMDLTSMRNLINR